MPLLSQPSPASVQSASRLGWVVGLRLSFLAVLFGLTGIFYLRIGFGYRSFSIRILFYTLLAACAATGVLFALVRRRRHLGELVYVELVLDQLFWTVLIYVTGGATSGATALYGLTSVLGSILVGPRGALLTAVAGGMSYSLLCAGFVAGLLVTPPDQDPASYITEPLQLAYPYFLNLLVLIVVALLAEYLAERLRLTGGRLAEATQRAHDAERLAALGRIAAGLAHEIRNPLGSIVGSVQLLRSAKGLEDESRRLCGIVERETARINNLVEDMMQLARPHRPVLTEVDVARTTREVVALATQSGRGSDVVVRYDGPDENGRLPVRADAGQLRQVVWNLVRNAVQASSPGDQVLVRVFQTKPGGAVRMPSAVLEVHDDGPGIGPEARERLFDAFFTTRSSGIGIGLAVVKQIVDDHGWNVDVDSTAGRGATFRVTMVGSTAGRSDPPAPAR
jgi:two-component system, NtrC family, sensor histidine kinase HydH